MLIKIFIVIIRVCNDNKNKLFQYMYINQTPEKINEKTLSINKLKILNY
jgi:hypothetical protein